MHRHRPGADRIPEATRLDARANSLKPPCQGDQAAPQSGLQTSKFARKRLEVLLERWDQLKPRSADPSRQFASKPVPWAKQVTIRAILDGDEQQPPKHMRRWHRPLH